MKFSYRKISSLKLRMNISLGEMDRSALKRSWFEAEAGGGERVICFRES